MAQNGITNYAEIQQNEIDALKSIFMEDFEEEEIKAVAWNRKSDRRFRLKLWPLSGATDQIELFAILSVALPTAYPKQVLECTVEFGGKVPQKTRALLNELVPEKIKALIGNEAVYEIAELVQEKLEEALTAVTHTDSLPALDEERVNREAEAAQHAETVRNQKLEAQKRAQKQQDEARSQAIGKEVEAQRLVSRNMLHLSNASSQAETPDYDVRDAIVFDEPLKTKAPSGKIISFRAVRPPSYLDDGPVTTIGITTPAERRLQSDLPTLALKTCEVGRGWDKNELKAEIDRLEANLKLVQRLVLHRNILTILDYQIEATTMIDVNRTWSVKILNEYMKRGSMRCLLDAVGKLEMDTFRSLATQILEGAEHLHTHQIPHGRLSLDNLLLERRMDSLVVKISDMLYQSDLHHLKKPNSSSFSAATSVYWEPPENAQSSVFRPSPPADVWNIGIVMLQMLLGVDIQSKHSAPSKISDDLPLNGHFENLIERIFKADPARRPSCFDLQAHSFIREDVPALDQSDDSPLVSRVTSESTPANVKPWRARLGSHGQGYAGRIEGSRYSDDFNELGRLGKGGFGQVFRARNKLDGRSYAVKKIVSESDETLQGVLGEVMVLSRLYHPNIVRYVTAWIEKTRMDRTSAGSDSEDDSDVEYDLDNRQSNLLSHSQAPRSRGLDFISSKAGPDTDEESDEDFSESDSYGDDLDDDHGIVFGEDDDDDDGIVFGEDSNTGSGSAITSAPATPKLQAKSVAGPSVKRPRRQSSSAFEPPIKITLYIQMEFCDNQTLRDVIRNDMSNNPDECFRYLRQILAALVYVHSNGIIHRDLKPENIFVSGSNIRLGDFGLAKPQVKERHRGGAGNRVGALTASIGTSVYIAPEVRSSGGGTYDEKADMYSLGVILFEMCYSPRSTLMERAATLNDLKKEPPILPDVFEEDSKALEKEIICSLLIQKPADRSSSTEILAKLPSEADDEAITQRIDAALANENDPLYGRIVKQVFNRPVDSPEAKHYMYDIGQTKHYSSAEDAYFLSLAKERLIHVFRRHCAVESTRQSFVPNTDHWTETVKVLDESGQILHLPYDLTLSGARLLAKNGKIAPCKSYSIGPVYRQSDRPAQHPLTSIEIDFDIISENSLDPALREAETIKVMDEIIDAIPALSSLNMCFHINHCDLLDTILRACKVPSSKMRQAKDVISRLGHKTFAQVRAELRGPEINISSTSTDDLARYDFRDNPDAAIRRLKELIGKNESLEPTFGHIRALVSFTKSMRVKRKIFLSPLSCHSAHFYTGSLMFQCLFDGRKKKTVLCAGGRYDRLIREHASNRSVSPCFAVGFQLSWESLVNALMKYRGSTGKAKEDDTLSQRRGDVLVTSNDGELLRKDGLGILEELWANDIRAELAMDAVDSEAHSYRAEASQISHDWVLYVKPEGMIRFRNLFRNDEEEILRTELISHLRAEIRERDRERKTIERPRLPTLLSDQNNSGQKGVKVHVLWAQTRSKKSNRQMIVSEAQQYTSDLTEKHRNGPIVAVELKDDLFEMMRGIRVDDNESWKRVSQNADVNARQYMVQVHQLLVELSQSAQGAKNAFLYNFRSKACMLYDLTRS